MEDASGLSVLLLGVSTGSEVASPVVILLVSVGEHVVVTDGPFDILNLHESVNVLRRSRH